MTGTPGLAGGGHRACHVPTCCYQSTAVGACPRVTNENGTALLSPVGSVVSRLRAGGRGRQASGVTAGARRGGGPADGSRGTQSTWQEAKASAVTWSEDLEGRGARSRPTGQPTVAGQTF